MRQLFPFLSALFKGQSIFAVLVTVWICVALYSGLAEAAVDFESLAIKKAEVHSQIDQPQAGKLHLRGVLKLGSESNGIDPLKDGVTLTIFDSQDIPVFAYAISPRAFRLKTTKRGQQQLVFRGKFPGELSRFDLLQLSPRRFRFEIRGEHLQIECCQFASMVLQVGDDQGTALLPSHNRKARSSSGSATNKEQSEKIEAHTKVGSDTRALIDGVLPTQRELPLAETESVSSVDEGESFSSLGYDQEQISEGQDVPSRVGESTSPQQDTIPTAPQPLVSSSEGLADSSMGEPNSVPEQALAEAAANFSGIIGSLDVDENGLAEAGTDGQIILRFLFGLRGPALIDGVLGAGAQRNTPEDLASYLESVRRSMLDVDCNGVTTAMTDGLLVIRFLEGHSSDQLTNGVVDPSGCRTVAGGMIDFLDDLLPGGVDNTPPVIIPPNDSVIPVPDNAGALVSDPLVVDFLNTAEALDNVSGTFVPNNDAPSVFPLGETLVTFTGIDMAGNSSMATATVTVEDQTPPDVSITSPAALSLFSTPSTVVTGSLSEPVAGMLVNGVSATIVGLNWSALVSLEEGNNLLTAVATDFGGNAGTASIQVTLDSAPPTVTIDSPVDGLVTNASFVTVAGMINDIVVGTVNGQEAQVTVNGLPAVVANRNFLVETVSLSLGSNLIEATGMDAAGNVGFTSITVLRQDLSGQPNLALVSGNNQVGPIGTLVAAPLVVNLVDGAGDPVSNQLVIFKVIDNNGTLSTGGGEMRSVIAMSDVQGQAPVQLRLGTRAGVGNNRVEATALGFAGVVTFTASGLSEPAAKISIDGGNHQTGVGGQPLPQPFTVVMTDFGHNRLANIPVTFSVTEGGGMFGTESSLIVNTDTSGRASAVLTLGLQEGIGNHVVQATFPGNAGFPASFVASGFAAGDPNETQIKGVVLNNTDSPIPGVTIQLEGTALTTQTDAQGQFVLQPAPVGHVHLIADGATAQLPGTWPKLAFELVTVPGQVNTLGMPIYLLPLDLPNGLFVSETQGGTLTLPAIPGFSLTIQADSATFPDDSKSGLVSVTVVHADKVPMVPNFGQQPRLVVTIQPAGVHFNPPAPITIPNVDGLPPGAVTDIYSFDHDLGQFVSIGPGAVSEDGTVVASQTGVGIIKGGWHSQGDPEETGSVCTCAACRKCAGDNCVADDADLPPQNSSIDCLRETCQSGSVESVPEDSEMPPQVAPDDCFQEICAFGEAIPLPDNSEIPPQFGNAGHPASGDCRKQVCMNGSVLSEIDNSEEPEQTEADCERNICRQGDVATIDDDADTPPEVSPHDCEKWECFMGGLSIVADLTESPDAVEITDDCVDRLCDIAGIMLVPNDNEVPPQTDGDCERDICRGGDVATVDDNQDLPPQDSPNDCVEEVCQLGSPISVPNDSETPIQVSSSDCVTDVCENGEFGVVINDSETPIQIAPDDCLREICVDSFSVSIPDLTEPGCSAP